MMYVGGREVLEAYIGSLAIQEIYLGHSLAWCGKRIGAAAFADLCIVPTAQGLAVVAVPVYAVREVAIAERDMAALSPTLAGTAKDALELGGGSGLALQLSQLISATPHLPVSTDAEVEAGHAAAVGRTQETLGGHAAVIAIRPVWCNTHNDLLRVDAAPVAYPGALFRVREELLDGTVDAVSAAGCAGERLTSLWRLLSPAVAAPGAAADYERAVWRLLSPAVAAQGAAAVYDRAMWRLLSPAAAAQSAAMREAKALWLLFDEAQASMAVAAGTVGQMESLRADAAAPPSVAGLAQKEIWQGTGSANAAQTLPSETRTMLSVAYDAFGAAAHTKAAGAAASVRAAAKAALLGVDTQDVGTQRCIRSVPAATLLLTNTLGVESAARMRVTGTLAVETVASGRMGYAAALTENEASIHGAVTVPAAGEPMALQKYAAMELATGGWDDPVQTGGTVYITQAYDAVQSGDTLEVS